MERDDSFFNMRPSQNRLGQQAELSDLNLKHDGWNNPVKSRFELR